MTYRGHETNDDDYDDAYVYTYADGTPVESEERPCKERGLIAAGMDEPDPCLGWIDGVRFACCGHGTSPMQKALAVPTSCTG